MEISSNGLNWIQAKVFERCLVYRNLNLFLKGKEFSNSLLAMIDKVNSYWINLIYGT